MKNYFRIVVLFLITMNILSCKKNDAICNCDSNLLNETTHAISKYQMIAYSKYQTLSTDSNQLIEIKNVKNILDIRSSFIKKARSYDLNIKDVNYFVEGLRKNTDSNSFNVYINSMKPLFVVNDSIDKCDQQRLILKSLLLSERAIGLNLKHISD